MMQLIDGKKVAEQIKEEIALEVKNMINQGGKIPHLAAILVGHDGGSETYVAHKITDCKQVGIKSTLIRLDENISEEILLNNIKNLNDNADIDGFIVQLPLPKHINEQKVIESFDYKKDVDGFHPINVGRLVLGIPTYLSATPAGIIELFKRYKIETQGKHCVILGRSNIVGRPMSILMSQKNKYGNATVTVCHSQTKNLKEICADADILIAALGSPEFVSSKMVKPGAVVIDVGTTRVANSESKNGYKLKGDVKFDEVAPKCSYITPVPGGVGPMTRVTLLQNTLLASKKIIYS